LERRLLLSSALVRFAVEQTIGVGLSPDAVVAADLNGDGKTDLVVANYGSNSVGVLLGNGNGTFHAEQEFPVGQHPLGVTVADVNGDGKPDLITANFYNGTLSVLLGNGNGTFQSQHTFSAGSGAANVVAADVNGDGKPDLIVTNAIAYTVSVLLSNGNGTFQPQRTFAVGSFPRPLAVADLNGDGKPDLIVGNYGATTVSILLGNGNGTFQPQNTVAVGGAPLVLALADLNGDGMTDLVVANPQSNVSAVDVLLGNGNGTFQARQTFATGRSPSSVVVADLNGDGRPDLAVTNYSNQTVGVLLGNGNGTFQPQQTTAVSSFAGHITAADLDGDGIPDLIVAQQSPNNVGVLLNRSVLPQVLSINRTNPVGASTSDSSVTFTVTFNKPVTGVSLNDFSAITSGVTVSLLGLIPVSSTVYTVTVSGITGSGSLGLNLVDNGTIRDLAGNPLVGGPATFAPPLQTNTFVRFVSALVQDINGDGKPDLVIGGFSPIQDETYVTMFLGNGNGTFSRTQENISQNPGTDAAGYAEVLTDLNGDGKPDLVVDYTAYKYGTIAVLLGNGNGTFKSVQGIPAAGERLLVAVGDFNGDGKPDLVVAGSSVAGSGGMDILLGNGNGTFQNPSVVLSSAGVNSIAVGDLNGDGKPDLVVAHYGTRDLGVLLGNGNGTFRQQLLVGGGYFDSAAVADVNGDGIPDIVALNERGSLNVLLGNGNGTFQVQQTFATGGYPSELTMADMNGDGNPDTVYVNRTPNSSQNTLGVLLSNGNGTFRAPQTFAQYAGTIAVSDVNGDGVPDVVSANFNYPPGGGSYTVMLAQTNGSLTGQTYTIIPVADTITGTSGIDSITLIQDPDHVDIDWTLTPSTGSPTTGVLPINDPSGLTINGNGNNDIVILDYTNGDPQPNIMHLNSGTGNFTINNLQGTNPLAGTTLDIGRSTVFISYSGSDPIAAIQGYLRNGYNGGAWNGTPTASTGVITSAAAQANPNHNTAIGYADFADGQGINTMANTIELTYTLYGDANLDHQVNSADLQILLAAFNNAGAWDRGDFNYDGMVNSADLQALLATFNMQLGSQATPLAIAAAPAATTATTTSAPNSGRDTSPALMPAINTAGSATPTLLHLHPAKAAARKRR
jgi:hypothetical protein